MTDVPLLPLFARPVFARKLLAVWRLQHLDQGEDLRITVYPGEWPPDTPREVRGVEVCEDVMVGGGGVLVMGRARGTWRWCCQMAAAATADMSASELAVMTMYGEVRGEGDQSVWMHPDPRTGEVPMWTQGGKR